MTNEELEVLERADAAALPPPWQWWTSNSHNRLGTPNKADAVAYGYTSRDGVGNIAINELDMAVLVAARNALPALIRAAREQNELLAALHEFVGTPSAFDGNELLRVRNNARTLLARIEGDRP